MHGFAIGKAPLPRGSQGRAEPAGAGDSEGAGDSAGACVRCVCVGGWVDVVRVYSVCT